MLKVAAAAVRKFSHLNPSPDQSIPVLSLHCSRGFYVDRQLTDSEISPNLTLFTAMSGAESDPLTYGAFILATVVNRSVNTFPASNTWRSSLVTQDNLQLCLSFV